MPTSSLLYRDCMGPLADAGVRALAPDLPGYGASEHIDHDLSVDAHLDWLEALLDDLACGPVHVAGVDLGGLLAVGLTLRGRTRSLSLTSTAIGPGWMPAQLTAMPGLELFFYRLYGGRLWLRQGVAPERVPALLALHSPRLESDPQFTERMRRTALAFSWRHWARWPQALAASPVPKQLIWGSEDRFFRPWVAQRIAASLDCPLHWIEGGRHHLPFGRPTAWTQQVLALIRDLPASEVTRAQTTP